MVVFDRLLSEIVVNFFVWNNFIMVCIVVFILIVVGWFCCCGFLDIMYCFVFYF